MVAVEQGGRPLPRASSARKSATSAEPALNASSSRWARKSRTRCWKWRAVVGSATAGMNPDSSRGDSLLELHGKNRAGGQGGLEERRVVVEGPAHRLGRQAACAVALPGG